MIRTRVGYCGGDKLQPSYRAIGDHTETIEIDFDPKVTSYEEMLRVFLAAHNATGPAWSCQYRSVVFAHSKAQAKSARRALDQVAATAGKPVSTAIESEFQFWLAEDYHQKYRLRRHQQLDNKLQAIYPDLQDYVDSTVVTRLNAWVANNGSPRELNLDLSELGLDNETTRTLAKTLGLK